MVKENGYTAIGAFKVDRILRRGFGDQESNWKSQVVPLVKWQKIIYQMYPVLKLIMIWPQGYKTFFMLNSAEHEIFSANKYENANNSYLTLSYV